jgi:hypothetical protein
MAARMPPETYELWAKTIGKYVHQGFAPPGSRVAAGELNATTAAADEFGLAPRKFRHHVAKMIKQGYGIFWGIGVSAFPSGSPIVQAPAPEVSPVVKHDTDFWRKRATALGKELGAAQHTLEQLNGVRDIPYAIPEWLLDTKLHNRGRSVIGCLLSDIHMGEVISAEEIQGINEFNPEICKQRLEKYFKAACEVGERWSSDTDCDGVLLALAGDLTSGDIHEELRMTNALTSHEQVQAVVETVAPGIKLLKEQFGRVHVVVVPGNHGRTTIKPTAKLYARLSYDTLIGSILQREFAEDDRITFQFSAAKDQLTPIYGRTILTTHGDKIGTRGGMGFAGPMLPIVRGSKKIEAQQSGIGRRPDLIQFGHYHTTGNPGLVLANGSVPGYSEYADDLRAVVEPPQQWLYLLHSRWWLRERSTIQLEEPGKPEKPRVTVPAGWSVAA